MINRVRKTDGVSFEVPCAKRGNEEYAYHSEKKFIAYKQGLLHDAINFTIMFITLVTPYKNSWNECLTSWKVISKVIKLFIKALKRNRAKKHLAVIEATTKGVCHAHILIKWNIPLQTYLRDGKYYLADNDLLNHISTIWEKCWMKVSDRMLNNNSISIQVCPNKEKAEEVFNYVTKHLGKHSNIYFALQKFKANKANDLDKSKLLTNFWGYKLDLRLYYTSKNLWKTV